MKEQNLFWEGQNFYRESVNTDGKSMAKTREWLSINKMGRGRHD